ncbi:MAG: hypothetical protein Q9157_002357 [Trypethelium eluteriae]
MLSSLLLSLFAGLVSAQSHGHEFGYGVPSQCSELPSDFSLVNQTYVLPDPFQLLDAGRVTNQSDWQCRAEQIRALFQKYELGDKPPQPSTFTPTFANKALTINAGVGSKTISFSVPITYPTSGKAPYPAVIVYDAPSIPIPSNVAVITLNIDNIAQQNDQSSRGVGLFYDLYGKNATAGALMAWAWAVSRVVDSLEMLPAAQINPEKLAVTGCSRNGKGAIVAGAFDERIALTIPQESGSGGDACWRTSRDMLVNQNLATQTANEIVGENVWFSTAFNQFAATNYTVGLLPVDHHELAGLVAPRGLYSTENVGFLWLGDFSNLECMTAANKIYQALGATDHQGFSQDGPHDHCSFPNDQISEINAFFNRFLLDEQVNTSIFRTVGSWTFNASWTPWQVPTLA